MDPTRHAHIATDDIHPAASSSAKLPSSVRPTSRSSSRGDGSDIDGPEKLGEDDFRNGAYQGRPKYTGWLLAWLAYQSTGVIYGDIGTSPLYVYSSTFTSEPSYADLLGVLSIIIWTLTLIVSVKYVGIVLYADDDGEGGTFALYSLLARYANITRKDPTAALGVKMERYLSSDIKSSNRSVRSILEASPVARSLLKILGVLGVSLIIADGILTPAQSVLGAIQGLTVVNPNISRSTIVGVSCAIIVLLYLVQPLGTSKIASTFAPIVIIWLLANLCFGIYNLVKFDHSVLKAFSPYFAGQYFVRNGTEGWKSLGGILLVFTGVEALFADLGAFSRKAIQLSWLLFAFPCLLVTYIGQAAYISSNKSAYTNPFFNSLPPGLFYPSLVLSILAAIVASQAIITGSFQLLSQVIKLSYFPQIKVFHTSRHFIGHIYIPLANWFLMVGTVVVTVAFTNTTSLGNAYGVCVILVTFITTIMVSVVALLAWQRNPFLVLAGLLVFGCLDGLYLTSALLKVPKGAWTTLAFAVVLSGIFALWRFGKEQQWRAEGNTAIPFDRLVATAANGAKVLEPAYGGGELSPIRGVGIFFDKSGWTTPTVFRQFVSKFKAQPEVTIFLHLRALTTATVPLEERCTASRVTFRGTATYRVVVRHGYNDVITMADLARLVREQLTTLIVQEDVRSAPVLSNDSTPLEKRIDNNNNNNDQPRDRVAAELEYLRQAYAAQVTYLVGKDKLYIRDDASFVRRMLLSAFIWMRVNTHSRVTALKIPGDQLVEMGFITVV